MQSQPFKKRWGSAIAGTAVIATVIASAAGIAANAAVTDEAEGEGQMVNTGSLAPIANLAGAYSVYEPGSVNQTNLLLTALETISLTVPTLVDIPLDELIQLGVVGQHGESDETGAFGAAGAITQEGLIDLSAADDITKNSTVDLGPVLAGVPLLDGVISDFGLELGAVAAWAEAVRGPGDPTIDSDYMIASGNLNLTSPLVAEITDLLTGAGGVVSQVDAAVNSLVGSGGLLAQVLATLNAVLGPIVGDPDLAITIDVDVLTAIDAVLDAEFTDGVVDIDLRTGEITVDLDALLMDQEGYGLNDLPPNTEILSSAVLGNLVDRIGVLVATIPTLVQTALTSVLEAAVLNINADICLAEVIGCVTEIQVSVVDQTLADVVDGTADATITLTVLSLPVVIPVGTLLSALIGPLDDVLFGATGIVSTITTDLTTAVSDLLGELDPALDALNEVVSLLGNVQEDPGNFDNANGYDDDSFTQRALSLTLLPLLEGPTVSLASATVRALPLAAADADVTDADVTDEDGETEADTDAVSDQDGDSETTDGDTVADADADADGDGDAPAGDGDADGNLATTGFDGMVLGGFGILALLTGLALYLARRKSLEV